MPALNPFTLKLEALQRQQAIADALQQQGMAPDSGGTMSGTGSNPVYVKTSPYAALAKLAQTGAGALLTNHNQKQRDDIANQMMAAQQQSLTALSGDSDSSSQPTAAPQGSSGAAPATGTPGAVPPMNTSPPLPPPLLTNPGYQPPPSQPMPPSAAAPPPTSPVTGRGIGGPSLGQTLQASQNAIMYGVDPKVVEIAAQARAPTPEQRNIQAVYGNSPEARATLERMVNPAVATNANSPLARFNPTSGQYETAYAPPDISKGIAPVITNGQITGVQKLPGSEEVNAGQAAATTAATQANTPKWIDDPLHPGQGRYVYPTPPAYAGGGINDLGAIGRPAGAPNAADLEGQKVGAKTGQDYAASLNESANSAIQGKRTLSEMQNLLQGFNPSAGAPMLSKIGAAAEALGVDPATVQSITGNNTGDMQAFQKGTAALAGEAAKQVTNKVTQTEFKVFLANNPNWMMTPQGIKRVMSYMGQGFDSQLQQQQEFSQFSKKTSPDRWAIDFPAAWNQKQLAAIKAGQTNSAPAALTGIRTAKDTQAAAGAQGGPVQWQSGMTIDSARKQYKPGTVFQFPDGSHGSL